MDCRNALAQLYEYLDGEIGDAEREAIAVHVKACRQCFDQFEIERLFVEFVEHRAPRIEARSEFKAHILARLKAEEAIRPAQTTTVTKVDVVPLLTRFAVAAGLVLAVGLGSAWMDRKAGPQRMPWRTLAGYHHEMIPVKEVGIETGDYDQARAFLVAQMNPGVATLLPESVPPGVSIHESCVMPWGGDRLGRLAFDGGEAGPISFFVIPANSFQFSDEARIQIADRNYRSVKLGCCRAVCWDEGGEYVCVMLGDCGANDLLAYAESWHSAPSPQSPGGASAPSGGS